MEIVNLSALIHCNSKEVGSFVFYFQVWIKEKFILDGKVNEI